jgi:DNA-binding Xre family transcriptional regulator
MLKYKIDILKSLKAAGYTTSRLREEKLLSESTMQKIRRGEVVGIIAIERICELLNLQPGDVLEHVANLKND